MTSSTPDRITSHVSFTGEHALEHMQEVRALVLELGGSAVTLAGREAAWFSLSRGELARQRLLDTPLASLLHEQEELQTVQFVVKLSRWKIFTARDALVLGRRGIAGPASTPLRRQRIEAALASHLPGEQYLDAPTPTDVAGMCFALDQVHASVLPSIQRSKPHLPRDGTSYGMVRLNVSDLLGDQADLPEDCVVDYWDDAHNEATRFAAEFLAARREIGSGPVEG